MSFVVKIDINDTGNNTHLVWGAAGQSEAGAALLVCATVHAFVLEDERWSSGSSEGQRNLWGPPGDQKDSPSLAGLGPCRSAPRCADPLLENSLYRFKLSSSPYINTHSTERKQVQLLMGVI